MRCLSLNPGNRGLKTLPTIQTLRDVWLHFVAGNVAVHGSQWVVWALIQALERYVYIVCVCEREVDGKERGVPADAVSHLLDKSLICVTQRGITGYWEEKNWTLNAPFKPDTQFV